MISPTILHTLVAVAQEVGGVPALTAALAIAGGIFAAVIGRTVLRQLRIDDWRAHGLAAGVAGSGVAAAQVAPLDGLAATFRGPRDRPEWAS